MFVNKFEYLPHDILFEIFDYLSPIEILQSFLAYSYRWKYNVIINV
jgi:hypothetical protein